MNPVTLIGGIVIMAVILAGAAYVIGALWEAASNAAERRYNAELDEAAEQLRALERRRAEREQA